MQQGLSRDATMKFAACQLLLLGTILSHLNSIQSWPISIKLLPDIPNDHIPSSCEAKVLYALNLVSYMHRLQAVR
jgi:hypothetical protein